jgi:hypothetical protein
MVPRGSKKDIHHILNSHSSRRKLLSWLCSTTFIVSPTLGDAYDFRIDLKEGLGPVLEVARFENKYVRSTSTAVSTRSKSIALSGFREMSSIECEGLTLKLQKLEDKNRIQIQLFKGSESLGYLEVTDTGEIHVSTKAISDHIFISSTKDVHLEGHTVGGEQECSLTLQTSKNVYLSGKISVHALSIDANRIVSGASISARSLRYKGASLETVGEYTVQDAEIDLKEDWNNNAEFRISGCLALRAQTLRNRRKIATNRIHAHKLSVFDNSNTEGELPEFIAYETPATLDKLDIFKTKVLQFSIGVCR